MSVFWNNVLYQMATRKKSQVALASHIGKTKGTVNTWIKRDTIPQADYACGIANFLGTTVEALFNEELRQLPEVEKVKYSPETRKIVQLLLPLDEPDIERIRFGIATAIGSLGLNQQDNHSANAG